MRRSVKVIKQLLDDCSEEDRDQWKSDAQTVLEAVRASHPTRRGVKSAIAAAFFENSAMPLALNSGWSLVSAHRKPPSYFAMEKGGRVARILISVLQVESGKPLRLTSGQSEQAYISQLPRHSVRGRAANIPDRNEKSGSAVSQAEGGWLETDFDVLAVSVQPVTHHWPDFRYALSSSLAASRANPAMLADRQHVSLDPSGGWTSDLLTSLAGLSSRTDEFAESRTRAI